MDVILVSYSSVFRLWAFHTVNMCLYKFQNFRTAANVENCGWSHHL